MTSPSTTDHGIDPSQIDSDRVTFADASFLTEFVRVFGPQHQGKKQFLQDTNRTVLGTKKTRDVLQNRVRDRDAVFRELARRVSTHPDIDGADPAEQSDILAEDIFAYDEIETAANISLPSDFRDALEDLRTTLEGKPVDDITAFLHDYQRQITRRKQRLRLIDVDWQPLQCHSNLESKLATALSDDVIYSEVAEIVTHPSQDRKLVVVDEHCPLLGALDDVNELIAEVLTPSNKIDADYLTEP